MHLKMSAAKKLAILFQEQLLLIEGHPHYEAAVTQWHILQYTIKVLCTLFFILLLTFNW